MRYRLSEIEIARPLEPLEFEADESGAALLIRRNGRPIGFFMRQNSDKRTWSPEELSEWISHALKTKIVEEAIRDELAPPRTNVSFPSLSVAICTRNRVATLKRCLDSALPLQQKYGFELLVIDNAPSDDTTAKLVKGFSTARYALEQRPGLDGRDGGTDCLSRRRRRRGLGLGCRFAGSLGRESRRCCVYRTGDAAETRHDSTGAL